MKAISPDSISADWLTVWRISNHADLSGEGGLRASGRWHSAGRPIVYLASSPASALLEVLVHFEANLGQLPTSFQLLEVSLPASSHIPTLSAASLKPNWGGDSLSTQALGDAWLAGASSLAMWVPSAIAPHTNNLLFNPLHRHAKKATVKSHGRYPFDVRLLH
jgi:RES domain-containing protein